MPLLLSPASSTTPSPAILDFLAQLSPPPSPNSPPTPAFLCPGCERPELSSARRRRKELPTSASTNPAVTPADLPKHHSPSRHSQHHSKTSNNQYDNFDFSIIAAVPPKYEKSADGFWHPATSWSFHGKTSLPNLFSSPTPSPAASSFPPNNVVIPTQLISPDDDGDDDDDNNLTTSFPDNGTVVSTIASDYDAIKDSLPTGWTITPKRTKFYSVEVIVVVSLILAILLSLIIAGCVLGHKARSGSRRQSFKKILNEAKARAHAQKSLSRTSSRSDIEVDTETGDPELEILSDSERTEKILRNVRRKERLWDKWRNKGGKLSDLGLRRRKKKNTAVNSTARTPAMQSVASVIEVIPPTPTTTIIISTAPVTASSTSLDANIASTSTLSAPAPATSQPSPRLANILPNVSSLSVYPNSLQPSTSSTASLLSLSSSLTSHRHPPAYRHGALVNEQAMSSSITRIHVNQTVNLDDHQDNSYTIPGNVYSFDQDEETRQSLEKYPHPEYPPPPLLSVVDLPDRAHVATDDKSVLERMRRGVSEPQDAATSASITHLHSPALLQTIRQLETVVPNVPVWVDESLESFEDLEGVSNRNVDAKASDISVPSSHNQSQLPPLPSSDLHRCLERHYNANAYLPLEDLSILQPLSSSAPPLADAGPSSPYLQPSAPPSEDIEEGSLELSNSLRPSAPPLPFDEDSPAENGLPDDDGESGAEENRDERQSRWDREADLEATLARTRSTPSMTAAAANGTHYSRSRRRRSLSTSSTANDSSSPNKRLSLPRYEP